MTDSKFHEGFILSGSVRDMWYGLQKRDSGDLVISVYPLWMVRNEDERVHFLTVEYAAERCLVGNDDTCRILFREGLSKDVYTKHPFWDSWRIRQAIVFHVVFSRLLENPIDGVEVSATDAFDTIYPLCEGWDGVTLVGDYSYKWSVSQDRITVRGTGTDYVDISDVFSVPYTYGYSDECLSFYQKEFYFSDVCVDVTNCQKTHLTARGVLSLPPNERDQFLINMKNGRLGRELYETEAVVRHKAQLPAVCKEIMRDLFIRIASSTPEPGSSLS